jgi:hypothetical protein
MKYELTPRSIAYVDLPLFMRSAPHNGTPTSKDAAADIREHAPTLRAKVLAFVASRGFHGAAAYEIESALEMDGNTVRPRIVELREHGAIVPAEFTRKTPSGRRAVVWRLR